MGIDEKLDYTPMPAYISGGNTYDAANSFEAPHFTQHMAYHGVMFANIYGSDVEMNGGNTLGYTFPGSKKITTYTGLSSEKLDVVALHEIMHNRHPDKTEVEIRQATADQAKKSLGHAETHEQFYIT